MTPRLGGAVYAVQVAAGSKDRIKRSQVPCRAGHGREKVCLKILASQPCGIDTTPTTLRAPSQTAISSKRPMKS